MTRAVREHPRLVVAKLVGLLCLLGCGIALGLLLGGGGDKVERATQVRLVNSQQALRSEAATNRETRAQLDRSHAVRAHLGDRLRAAKRNNVKLRRDLRVLRRALLRARRQARD